MGIEVGSLLSVAGYMRSHQGQGGDSWMLSVEARISLALECYLSAQHKIAGVGDE